jgi:hypothetical protein
MNGMMAAPSGILASSSLSSSSSSQTVGPAGSAEGRRSNEHLAEISQAMEPPEEADEGVSIEVTPPAMLTSIPEANGLAAPSGNVEEMANVGLALSPGAGFIAYAAGCSGGVEDPKDRFLPALAARLGEATSAGIGDGGVRPPAIPGPRGVAILDAIMLSGDADPVCSICLLTSR